MTSHSATVLAVLLTVAFGAGVFGARFIRAQRDLDAAKGGARRAASTMRSARLAFLVVAVIIFAIVRTWLHSHG